MVTAHSTIADADRTAPTKTALDRKAGGGLLTEPASGGRGVLLDPSSRTIYLDVNAKDNGGTVPA